MLIDKGNFDKRYLADGFECENNKTNQYIFNILKTGVKRKGVISLAMIIMVAALLGGCAKIKDVPIQIDLPKSSVSQSDASSNAVPSSKVVPTSYAFHKFQWEENNSAVTIQTGINTSGENTLKTISLEDEVIRTTSYGEKELALELYWNDKYTLRTNDDSFLYKQGGEWQLVNADLYTQGGELVRSFSKVNRDEINKSLHKYRLPWRGIEDAVWLNDNIIALNGDDLLALYDVEKNSLQLINDWRKVKKDAYTTESSTKYGIQENWVDGGYYYYTASPFKYDGTQPPITLYRLASNGKIEQISSNLECVGCTVYDGLVTFAEHQETLEFPVKSETYYTQNQSVFSMNTNTMEYSQRIPIQSVELQYFVVNGRDLLYSNIEEKNGTLTHHFYLADVWTNKVQSLDTSILDINSPQSLFVGEDMRLIFGKRTNTGCRWYFTSEKPELEFHKYVYDDTTKQLTELDVLPISAFYWQNSQMTPVFNKAGTGMLNIYFDSKNIGTDVLQVVKL